MKPLNKLKQLLANKYNMKNLDKVKTIIWWQVTKNIKAGTMMINQSAFVKDFIIEKRLIECNTNIIPMKAGLAIKMSDLENYNKIDI